MLQSIRCPPSWPRGWRGAAARCHCPASPVSMVLHVASPEKDQNSNFRVQFLLNVYLFCTLVKSKIVAGPLVSGSGLYLLLLNYKPAESPLCDSTGSSFSVVTAKAGWEALGQWPQIPLCIQGQRGNNGGTGWIPAVSSGIRTGKYCSTLPLWGAGGLPSFWVLPTVGASLATFSRIDKSYLTFAWIK